MSREQKFRAWDIELKFMVEPSKYLIGFDGKVYFNNEGELIDQTNKLKVMQFTSHCDRNGEEIYDGDICMVWGHPQLHQNFEKKAQVIFCNRTYGFHFKQIIGMPVQWDIGHNDCEVIGNIYENPELLK